MLIKVIDARAFGEDLQAGDEVAVFDGEICVGSAVIEYPISEENPLLINVCMDDPDTEVQDGYIAGI